MNHQSVVLKSPSPSCSIVFFLFSSKDEVLIPLFAFFYFHSVVNWYGKVHYSAGSLFFCRLSPGLVVLPRLSDPLWISKSQVCASCFPGWIQNCAYTSCFYGQIHSFLHNSQWITLPTQLWLVLYFFWPNLLHSLIMWLIVLSLSPHYLHMLFCCLLSILDWI